MFPPCRDTIIRWKAKTSHLAIQDGNMCLSGNSSVDEIAKIGTSSSNSLELYNNTDETKPIELDNSCKIMFTNKFKYLGSIINFQLTDIKARIAKASKAMCPMHGIAS